VSDFKQPEFIDVNGFKEVAEQKPVVITKKEIVDLQNSKGITMNADLVFGVVLGVLLVLSLFGTIVIKEILKDRFK